LRRAKFAAAVFFLAPAIAYAEPAWPELTMPQSNYIEHCSGCHGMQGDSYPAEIPVLRDRIGYFMCTREGREYLIRLPNVAYAPLPDNQELADMMNFVVFGLGGASAPKGAKPFSAAEVGKLRTQALATESLIDARAEALKGMVRRCSVPESMNYFYDGQEQVSR
jgi:hypothetical protein